MELDLTCFSTVIDDLEQTYFQNTGYLSSIEIEPILQKYTVFNSENYALPFATMLEPWLVNRTTIATLGLQMPPDGTNANIWGAAWWDTWNITVLNRYIDAMYAAGYNNILPLPTDSVGETKFATYFGFPYGASVLNTKGRCGLNSRMEKALNDTIIRWRSMSNWTFTSDSGLYSNSFVPYTPGVLPWRETYASEVQGAPTFEEWLSQPPRDPADEPLFAFWDPSLKPPPYGNFLPAYGTDFNRIYPPTGAGYLGARLFGIARTSRNITRAYNVLIAAFARNRRHHVNCPTVSNNNGGGVSGYLGASAIPEYALTSKSFYTGLLDHTIAIGTPAAQGMSYGEIAKFNPMQRAFNDILYKNMSVAEALDRVCVFINNNTKPPCTADDVEPYLVEDLQSETITLKFKWKDVRDCNENLPNSAQIPSPLINAVAQSYTSKDSTTAKAIIGLVTIGLVLLTILMLLFVIKRNSPPVRAASWMFSVAIIFGGHLALVSVVLQVSMDNKVGWVECLGPSWFFFPGFGLVMGSLLVKTYRVDKIFRNQTIGFALPDLNLLGYIVLVEVVEVALLLVFQFENQQSSYTQWTQIPNTDYSVIQNACPKTRGVGQVLLYIVRIEPLGFRGFAVI
ncbi:hypothetical protein HDV00_007257 [Rhizophlyctis rosea]|nr:hypothetical protein HDV00_007257 [Rhizophlyctis rosea]